MSREQFTELTDYLLSMYKTDPWKKRIFNLIRGGEKDDVRLYEKELQNFYLIEALKQTLLKIETSRNQAIKKFQILQENEDENAFEIAPDYTTKPFDQNEPKIQKALLDHDQDLLIKFYDIVKFSCEENWNSFKKVLGCKIKLSDYSAMQIMNIDSITQLNWFLE